MVKFRSSASQSNTKVEDMMMALIGRAKGLSASTE